MRVVPVPHYLDDKAFDAVAGALGWPPTGRVLFDARATRWASPYGFTALLTAGQALREAGAEQPRLALPEADDVRSYWAKVGFFAHAAELFELHGRVPRRAPAEASDVLLPVTPVRASEDVHDVVGRIQDQAARILTHELHLEARATMRFSMALSEACQNVVEHAGTAGWVAVHAFTWRKRLGRRVVVIAVCDAGIGFRASLEAAEARRHGDRWGDAAALEAALIHNVSRFRDPGRGQGLAAISRYVFDWKGKISIRSGTARVASVPGWDDDPPQETGLPFFPGAQLQIVIPAQEPLHG
jgi:anti-sigma regulatory factor (Ser/Thr protein kinase)